MMFAIKKTLEGTSVTNTIDKLMILMYNIVLLAGASYLVVVHEVTGWIYLVALIFGATWDKEDKA